MYTPPGSWPAITDTLKVRRSIALYDRAGRDSVHLNTRGIKSLVLNDALGRVVSTRPQSDSMAVRDSLVYDLAGNVVKVLSRRGFTITADYDARNRDTLRVIPTVGTERKTYGGPLAARTLIFGIISLLSAGACATSRREGRIQAYLGAHPSERGYFLWQECPQIGWSSATAAASLGKPDSVNATGRWTYHTDGGQRVITLRFEHDTLQEWSVALSSKWQATQSYWVRPSDLDRVKSFLAWRPQPDSVVYMMYRRCPWLGMQKELLKVVAGPTAQVDSSTVGETHSILLSRHGATLRIGVAGDTVSWYGSPP